MAWRGGGEAAFQAKGEGSKALGRWKAGQEALSCIRAQFDNSLAPQAPFSELGWGKAPIQGQKEAPWTPSNSCREKRTRNAEGEIQKLMELFGAAIRGAFRALKWPNNAPQGLLLPHSVDRLRMRSASDRMRIGAEQERKPGLKPWEMARQNTPIRRKPPFWLPKRGPQPFFPTKCAVVTLFLVAAYGVAWRECAFSLTTPLTYGQQCLFFSLASTSSSSRESQQTALNESENGGGDATNGPGETRGSLKTRVTLEIQELCERGDSLPESCQN